MLRVSCAGLLVACATTPAPPPPIVADRSPTEPADASFDSPARAGEPPSAGEADAGADAEPDAAIAAGDTTDAKAMVSAFFARLRWSTKRSISYDDITTDMSAAALRKRVRFREADVEWHANAVGARWTTGADVVCETCAARGYALSGFELFDHRVTLFDVGAAAPRPAGLAADRVCDALRAAVESSLAGARVEACRCGPTFLRSDMAAHSLPGAPRSEQKKPPCDPANSASFSFSVPAIETAGWGSLEGVGSVDETEASVFVEARGPARIRFLSAVEGRR